MPSPFIAKLQELTSRLQGRVAGWHFLEKIPKVSSTCIGLDMGSRSVKGVLVVSSTNGFGLLKMAESTIPSGADQAQRTQALGQVLRDLDGQKTPVITAVGGPGAVLRSVTLPKMTPQELTTALSFEAEKYIPFKLEEAFIDSVILGDRPGGRMEVFLAAARKGLVNASLEILTSVSVTPQAVDLEALALANAWEVSHPEVPATQRIGLVHVGARGTILNFFAGLALEFSREIPLGGEGFTQAVGQGLQMDDSQAESIKCQPAERGDQVRAALLPRWEEWLTQVRQSFDFYENQFGHRVDGLFLSGGSARLIGFPEWIKEQTGLPTEIWNPLQGFSTTLPSQETEKWAARLGIAVGCAVRGVSR